MVKLNRIYTRSGDDGTTGLASGERVPKDDLRVETYGTVDEANAAIGMAVIHCPADDAAPGKGTSAAAQPTGAAATDIPHDMPARIGRVLRLVQHDMFDLGADIATPRSTGEEPGKALRIIATQTKRLENEIDEFNEHLEDLTSFVLPAGTPLAAALHLARTIVRRAERLGVTLMHHEPDRTNAEAIKYLNRLSDLLFVLSRCANNNGAGDVLWKPGATREA